MSNAKNPSAAVQAEPPELAAERDRLLPELERQAKAATGTAQTVLRKLHELITHTKPGMPFDFQVYLNVKNAFERFIKDPVLPPPVIIMQCVEYLQRRLVAFGFTGKMELPPGAPPLPPALAQSLANSPSLPAQPAPAPVAAPAARSGGSKDGFEGAPKPQKTMTLNPENSPPPPAGEPKAEQQQLESFKTWMKNPHVGKVKG